MIGENPFEDIKTRGETNEARKRFVSRDDIAKVMDECPDDEYRLLVAFKSFWRPTDTLRGPGSALERRALGKRTFLGDQFKNGTP